MWVKRITDHAGRRFGKLTAFAYMGERRWIVACDCGGFSSAFTSNLLRGSTRSCGCMTHVRRDADDRFWDRVDKSGGPNACWPWKGAINPAGYGVFHAGPGRTKIASRFAYESKRGRIPRGKVVLHSCDNPPCCNPRHLRAGTHADNANDAVAKGLWNLKARARGEQHYAAKLTVRRVRAIRRACDRGVSPDAMGRRFDIAPSVVYRAWKRINWRHVA